MIVVDSSVWIDYFNNTDSAQTQLLDNCLGVQPIAIGDLILIEVLQGFRSDKDFKTASALMLDLTIYPMLGVKRAMAAAEKYRILRKHSATVRKTNDIIIGSYCIDESLPLLFSDHDFAPMVKRLSLVPAFPS